MDVKKMRQRSCSCGGAEDALETAWKKFSTAEKLVVVLAFIVPCAWLGYEIGVLLGSVV